MDLTDFDIKLLACRRVDSRVRPAGEFVACYEATRKSDGERCHLAYVYEWDKRDVTFEELRTDRISLFSDIDIDESPSVFSVFDPHAADFGPEPTKMPEYQAANDVIFGEQ